MKPRELAWQVGCCQHPEFDGIMCQNCFTKGAEWGFFALPETTYLRDPSEEEYVWRYRYYMPIMVPEIRGVIYGLDCSLDTTLIKCEVDGVWDRKRPLFIAILVVIVAYFVTRFVSE